MNTGKIIKAIRKQKHISAETIAEALGVHPSTIYRWENGDIEKIPYQVLVPLAKVLNVNPVDLLGAKQDISNEQRLLSAFSRLTPEQQEAVIITVESMAK